jgi:hypothetical protein
MKPYIGITGFTKPEEVESAINAFPVDYRKLMVGVLATFKSLRGIPMKPKWAKQTPSPKAISDLFLDDIRVINLVHFSTEEGQEDSIFAHMLKIHQLAGPNFDGFQLNLAWPDTWAINRYRSSVDRGRQIVLQIGQKAVEQAGNTPQGVINRLSYYIGVIDAVLLDPSGGYGKPFDTERARDFLTAIAAPFSQAV